MKKGSIRFFVGFALVFGSAGAFEVSDASVLLPLASGLVGLVVLWSGAMALAKSADSGYNDSEK